MIIELLTSALKSKSLKPEEIAERAGRKPIPGKVRRTSLALRHLDSGSCNACELELAAVADAPYQAERFGITLASSPREADLLAVTGPMTEGMRLAAEATFEAMPRPRRVLRVGDCACGGGPFVGAPCLAAKGLEPLTPDPEEAPRRSGQLPVLEVRGCPPSPARILDTLLRDASGEPEAD